MNLLWKQLPTYLLLYTINHNCHKDQVFWKKQGIKITGYFQKQRKTGWNNGIFAKISYEISTVHKIHMQFSIDKNNILYSKMRDFFDFFFAKT
jgi:hypothetical protein